jgi:opacity protein-like surface antigen
MMTIILTLVTVLGIASGTLWAAAPDSQRAQRWQFSFPITFTFGANYDEQGTSVDIADDVGWGLGFGYHINEKFFVGVDFTWLDANYDAIIARDFDGDGTQDDSIEIGGTLDATNMQFVGQYNFMARRFTPFIRGSFGWTWVDSNIPSGQGESVCWWDPWYGYICDTWQPTYDDTAFSYGVGAGVRFDINDRAFLEGSYNILWVDFGKADYQSFDGTRINFGWLF